jgi:ankyrin repeat protein
MQCSTQLDILAFLLPIVPAETLASANESGNTPLHWAAMNGHIDTLRLLVPALPKTALFLKNQFGRDALSEAENAMPEGEKAASSPQQECVGYLLTFMELEKEKQGNEEDVEEPTEEDSKKASADKTDPEQKEQTSGSNPVEEQR